VTLAVVTGAVAYQSISDGSKGGGDDVWASLSGSTVVSPNPFTTMFVVRNGSRHTIVVNHSLTCLINRIDTFEGASTINVGTKLKQFNDPLYPGGDAKSDPCLVFAALGHPRCADVTVNFNFSTKEEPAREMLKQFRFVGLQNFGKFIWYEQPIKHPGSYCQS
jgi:hypothetical protein